MVEKQYIIGIDLGTTNSAVSFRELSREGSDGSIEIFPIPQLSGPGEISRLRILPSFLYLPGDYEMDKASLKLPWESDATQFVGLFARDQGAKVPQRMVASAKSWLCHAKVDRNAPILPWGAEADMAKVSPVVASAAYLSQMKQAWNHEKAEDEDQYFELQHIIITVPASFDEAARDLTVEAAHLAGIHNITLLEEPLAAFYSWLMAHEQDWDQWVRPGELILICDVGGGTTDFTLITVRDNNGTPVLDRTAVGDHLVLGGDNVDLALAHHLEGNLTRGLGLHGWQALCNQCREAKEAMLSGLEESKTITLVGQGRRLIADTVSTSLSRGDVEEIILNGFFPMIDMHADVSETKRQGITEFGLPYAADPAITRHLIRFLERHQDDVKQTLGRDSVRPDKVLFNGAALKPKIIQRRILEAIGHRLGQGQSELPQVLENAELDLAVALGASYYGLVKQGQGVRVGSGSARAFFLGVGKLNDKGAESSGPEKAICLVERGTQEGHTMALADKSFHVRANQPVSFDLYSSSFRAGDRIGDVIDIDDSLTPLPPLHTVIQYGKKAKQTTLPVKVEAGYTEVGTLALWCRSSISDHRWRLQFQLRAADPAGAVADQEIWEEALLDAVRDKIKEALCHKDGQTRPEHLAKAIQKAVDRPKSDWPLYVIRSMADQLMELTHARKLGMAHESRWYNLTGFCLRPGFGDALDEHRISRLWKIFDAGPINGKNAQVRSEWWVFWRRLSGGLSPKQQRYMSQKIASLVRPKGRGVRVRLGAQEHMEIWMALANLERLAVLEKVEWGRQLLDQLSPKSRYQYWWSLSRIGARDLLYGPVDRVIPADTVTAWIRDILAKQWPNPKPVGTALAHMARLTGDRKRDLSPKVRQQVMDWLRPHDWADLYLAMLNQVVPITRQEQGERFGESVPPGIVMGG